MIFRNIACFTLILGTTFVASAAPPKAKPVSKSTAIPRLSDGKPDFNGIWQSISGADVNLQDHIADKYAPGAQSVVEEHEIPYLPEALKKRQGRMARWGNESKTPE